VRADHWHQIIRLASSQWSLVSTPQITGIGASYREIDRATERGLLVPFRRGVHLIGGAAPSPYQPILGACLAAGPSTVASFLAAPWLWDFSQVRSDHLEVTTLQSPTRDLADVRMHTTAKLLPGDVACRYGVPVTSPARTALDIASVFSEYLLGRFVDHLHRRRFAPYTEINRHLVALGGRGRPGTRKLRAVMSSRLDGIEPGDTDAEADAIRMLVDLGVPRPEQQVQVPAGPKVYVLDAAWPAAKVGLELAGFDPHGVMRSTFDHDRERAVRLKTVGWEVVEITTRTDLHLVARYLKTRLSTSE
jgi:very-short-patch-repair endonuclease